MTLHFRAYRPADRDACMALFQSNVPRFFRDHELADFLEFVDSSGCPYFVVLSEASIVGCGGFGIRPGSEAADLCWGMVDQQEQGKRIGEFLLLARLREIVTKNTVDAEYVRPKHVCLVTSQLTDGFFRRYGFQVQKRKSSGIAAGLDEVDMRMELNEVSRAVIEQEWRRIVG